MARIRGLELLFSLVKKQLKSKADCVVAALHCLLINDNLQCVGTGEEFSDDDASHLTELLPKEWNDNQTVYTLRYTSRDSKQKYLIKVVKAGNILHVNVVLNEDSTAAMSVNVNKTIGDDYNEYSDAYLDLDALSESFKRDIIDKLQGKHISPKKVKSPERPPRRGGSVVHPSSTPRPRPMPDFSGRSNEEQPPPSVGGRDLDPLGRGYGGMLFDPSNFGVPSRPFMPPFGGPGNLPRGAVPPGARFDPFGPPVRGPNRFNPNPDHFTPPDFDDFM